ncbi:unnamed protein product [Eruca vesicaria subsp. sativa]|uniref:Uncharacterized protein n=1 Tax=Eruca vesicaria subsp. sativa TaxID=29727 RepID=A0ABC8LIE0_ERUVS|nr:unnamed protein product [Eruca vesicaria subsp. sativa]
MESREGDKEERVRKVLESGKNSNKSKGIDIGELSSGGNKGKLVGSLLKENSGSKEVIEKIKGSEVNSEIEGNALSSSGKVRRIM